MRLCRQDAALPFVLRNRKIPKPVDNRAFDRHNNKNKKLVTFFAFRSHTYGVQRMKNIFSETRTPIGKTALSKAAVHTALIVACGALLGMLAKLLDIYTVDLGDVFSQMSVWIFLCTVIAVQSSTSHRAAVNVFGFCMAMPATYYLTGDWTKSVYSATFARGWTRFALLSPMFAFLSWYAKGKGCFAKLLAAGILLVVIAAAVIRFDRVRVADVVFAVLTGFVLRKNVKNG